MCGELFVTLLFLDNHSNPGMSIRNMANTWRQEIGNVMFSAQEKMMHQKQRCFQAIERQSWERKHLNLG